MTYIINPNETIPTIEAAMKHVNDQLRDADCGVTELYTEDYVELSRLREALTGLLEYLQDFEDVEEICLNRPQMELAEKAAGWAA